MINRGALYVVKDEVPFLYDPNTQTFSNLTEEDLKDLAYCINDPWSRTCEGYQIKVNCKDAYTEMEEGTPVWKCTYHVICNDHISASIHGYGMTEEEALLDCKDFFNYLQENYNIDID